ncbi:hypothetical protein BJX99DRAFT_261561 [Aspergillus californicus]
MRNLDMNGPSNGHTLLPATPAPAPAPAQTQQPEPIAIVGIGLRLPGKIHSVESLWDLLLAKKETSGPIPSSRFNAEGFYSDSKKPGSIGVQRGHFLDESDALDQLDTSFFSMGKAEVEKLDPQQRMLLEVVWECMENAGQTGWRGSDTGVFVGTWGDDWLDFLAKDPQQTGGMLNVSGAGDFAISNRISYEYNLTGPSMTIKAACASSMICLHEACQSLRDSACSAAIVAGTNLIITPTQTIAQTEAGVLSPTGQCRTFDASANGYARGEAINAILIKRLSDAVRDGDSIRAVIRATAVNCDGQSAGISAPNPLAHEKMIRRAYDVAGLGGSSSILETPFVEVHGTGTPSGDPLELQAIASVFGGEVDTYVGSIKANVGHGEGASGVNSIIKAVLMLENRIIPPQVNFATPNPKIPFEAARLVVPLEATLWPVGRPERISVNSFGITGANAHAIVESAASYGVARTRRVGDPAPRLLVMSANTAGSLKRKAAEIQSYAETYPERTNDLAYTLGCRRAHLAHRAFSLAGAGNSALVSERIKQTPTINFVFTGQGAQWATMGKELIEDFPQFKNDLAHMGNVLARLPHPPVWDLVEELLKPEPESQLNQAEFAQPLCTAVQVALVNLLATLGVLPAAVVGHSSGEIGAAYAAGAVTADEAITIAYYRGRTAVSSSRTGAMAALGMGRAEATLYLEDGVVVACDNSPNSVTLSGDKEALETVIEQMKFDDKDLFVRLLKTDGMAYHSHHMLELGSTYEEHLYSLVKAQPAVIPFFSSVTAKPTDSILHDAKYWRRNLESPVRFFPAVKSLVASQQPADQLFLEIGPHSALGGPLRQIFKTTAMKGRLTYLPTLVRGKSAIESILETCGQLYLHTVDVHLEKLTPGANMLTDIPAYPWQHDTSHWAETRAVREWRTRNFPPHELLGSRILEGNDVEPTWRNLLRLNNAPWLHDHKVLNDVVFPCAGYIAMVGEAVRQVTLSDDFSIRRLNIQTAMILNEDRTAEVVTSFKPNGNTPEWYDFTIYSHNGSAWTKHCNGQARGGIDSGQMVIEPLVTDETEFPREIRAPYPIFTRVGLHYGPTFHGLQSVSTLPGHRTAAASFRPPPVTGSAYPLHPTTIDQCLQLLGLAAAEGLAHHFEQILLPTGIENLYIQPGGNGEQKSTLYAGAKAIAVPGSSGDIRGQMSVVADGHTLLSAQGCKLSAFEQGQQGLERDERIAAARLSWRPDLDFVSLDRLMVSHVKNLDALQLMETYVFLCTVEIRHRIQAHGPYEGHFEKFARWIDALVEEGQRGENRIVSDSSDLVKLSADDRLSVLKHLQRQMHDSEFACVAELVTRLLDNCVEVFKKETEILDVYLRDNGLTKLYAITGDRIDSTEFFVTAGHTNPTMRILEIGGGTGGTTLLALQALTSINGEPMYSNYTFTDVSSGFFSAAKERFAAYSGLEFKTLDIGKDPAEQGFETGTYDLIIASNVIHATETLNVTLKNVRKLLHPRGRFFLQELTPAAAKMINLIMGPLPGWWLGEADGRAMEPIVSPERWDLELRNAGFDGIECVVYDDPNRRDHLGANMISRPVQPAAGFLSVTLLIQECQAGLDSVGLVKQALSDRGYQIQVCFLGTELPVYQDVISLVEIEAPFFGEVSSEGFAYLKQVIGQLGSSRLLWVMGSAQIELVDNPVYGLTLGLTRSIRAELSPSVATLEVDKVDQTVTKEIVKVFEKFQDTASSVNPDYEYVLKDGTVHVGRYHWTQVSKELARSQDISDCPLRLEMRREGGSKALSWVPYPEGPLGLNDVAIITAYAGASFKELQEGSGTVTAVGPEVHSLHPGDRVMYLARGCLSTRLTLSADQIAKIPDSLSFEEAAAMPLAYSTAIYSLLTATNIRKGQTILIESATSSIGLAGIQLCQMLGVTIYCTVEDNDAVAYLTSTFDIPRANIFDPGNTSSMLALLGATQGRGVDVVLNLSAGLLSDSWKCVAPRGKLIVLGKGDISQLDMNLLDGNRSFTCVDITTLEDLYQELLSETMQLYNEGHIKPITAKSVALTGDATENLSAIFSEPNSIGTTVVNIPQTPNAIPVALSQPDLKLREDRAYLLVGGLGGLGQSVSTYLVERGARHFIYLSRTAGESEGHRRFFRELESQGCSVLAVQGDVSNLADVRTAVASSSDRPIAGVLHMAMVLNDHPYMDMSHEDWSTAIKPKVDGTWNLHEALHDSNNNKSLDFFVIFGSVSGSFGIAHQANYAAANTFQDSFVRYRHARGLPASILNIGAMASVGYVSENKGVEEYFRNAGMPFLSEGDFFEALHLSIRQQFGSATPTMSGITNTGHLALGIRSTKPMDDPSNRVLWKHDRRVNIYRNIEAARLRDGAGSSDKGNGQEDKLAAFMANVRSNPSILDQTETLEFLTHEIGVNIYEFMLLPVDELDVSKALVTLGVDSLVIVEIRNWLRRKFEVEASTLEILNGGTIEMLGRISVERLKGKFANNQRRSAPSPTEPENIIEGERLRNRLFSELSGDGNHSTASDSFSFTYSERDVGDSITRPTPSYVAPPVERERNGGVRQPVVTPTQVENVRETRIQYDPIALPALHMRHLQLRNLDRSLRRFAHYSATPTSTPPLTECLVCMESLAPSLFPHNRITATCTHPHNEICKPCLKQSLETQLQNLSSTRGFTCPLCKQPLSESDFARWTTPEIMRRANSIRTRDALRSDPNFIWCSNPQCKAGQFHAGGADNPIIMCLYCRRLTCFVHQRPWYEGVTCYEFDHPDVLDARLERERVVEEAEEVVASAAAAEAQGSTVRHRGGN